MSGLSQPQQSALIKASKSPTGLGVCHAATAASLVERGYANWYNPRMPNAIVLTQAGWGYAHHGIQGSN